MNVLAILVQLGCLAFSRYVLGLDSVLADNISGTLIGQALATGLRYVLYTLWVFPHSPAPTRSPISKTTPRSTNTATKLAHSAERCQDFGTTQISPASPAASRSSIEESSPLSSFIPASKMRSWARKDWASPSSAITWMIPTVGA